MPTFITFETDPLIGTDHCSSLQSYVLSVLRLKVQAVGVVQARKGCRKVLLTSARSLSPASDQIWLTSAP